MSTSVVSLRQRRCENHSNREASARCPECEKFFCRECITEHDDRVVCASCLVKLTVKKGPERSAWVLLPKLSLAVIAFAVVYLAILVIGDFLASIPSHFHVKGGW